jgi:hypothetical protein
MVVEDGKREEEVKRNGKEKMNTCTAHQQFSVL